MTNEEVIKKIKSLCHGCVEFPHCVNTDPDCFKALEMAIKTLEQIPDLKEAYNKGYKDGQEALAYHIELCKDEGSIIEIPEGATNGDMIKAMFPSARIMYGNDGLIGVWLFKHVVWFKESWWNSPYRKEQE